MRLSEIIPNLDPTAIYSFEVRIEGSSGRAITASMDTASLVIADQNGNQTPATVKAAAVKIITFNMTGAALQAMAVNGKATLSIAVGNAVGFASNSIRIENIKINQYVANSSQQLAIRIGAGYKYGFNGMERDDEVKGSGNSMDFGARIYDPRLGRWLSPDPKEAKYPNISTYAFAANNPIYYIDPDGNEVEVYVTAKKVGTTKINLYSSSEIKADASLANKTKIVAVYEVRLRNESGSTATFYFTRTAHRGQSDGTTENVTFDVRNNNDEFLGQIKSRWGGTDNVLELRDADNINDQSVEAMKADVDAIRTAIQFHVKGASDGCLLCVGSGQFESKDETIDDTNLETNSSGSQRNFMDKIQEFQTEDQDNGYGTDINVKFQKSSSDDGATKKRSSQKYGDQKDKF